MSDINDNVSEQGSDIEQVGGQAESDSEYDSDMYMEGGKILPDSRDVTERGKKVALAVGDAAWRTTKAVGNIVYAPTASSLNVVGKIFGADRFPTPVPEFLRKKYPIISAGEIGERHQKVNQNNIGEHVIHDPGFRRSVKTATNPVFQHGITQYEAFDLFNGFKTCTVELLDELIRYFKNALSEQDTFTKSEWRVRYPEKHGATGNKLMVTKDEQKNEQKERENQDRGGDDDFFDGGGGGSSGGGPEDDADDDADDELGDELDDEPDEDESSKNKVEDKDIAIAFTDKVESFRIKSKRASALSIVYDAKGSTMKNSPFEGTSAGKEGEEGNRSYRYPQKWKEQNKKEPRKGDHPTFLKLMEREEILAILEHLTNIRKILTITTDIEIARNFINPGSDNKKNYLKTTNIKEDEIQDNVFDGDSRTEDSQFEEKKNDILQKIYLTNDAVSKAKKNRDLMAEQEEDLDLEDEGENIEQDDDGIKRNERNKKALDLYYNMKNENGITISLPPEFLLKSLEDKEKFEKKK